MQLAFASVGGSAAKTEWDRLREALIQAIAVITPKELCWRLGVSPSYLSDALEGRDRKSIKAEWIPVILSMAPDGVRKSVLEELAKPVGFDVAKRKQLTPEEKLAKAKERITQKFGQAGLELLAELEE